MNNRYQFESDRLGFRLWHDEDREPFARMNADPKVMRYFPKALSAEESNGFIERIKAHFTEHGYGLWAVEVKETQAFIGFIGFYTARFESDFTPCIEIGWRLDQRFWNKGYATEGALRCLEHGFNTLGMEAVCSFTSQINEPSIHVMQKIGLKEQRNFLHPNISEDNPLRPHVLYRIDRKTYRQE